MGPGDYHRSARTDLRIWLILTVGLVFAWAGSVIDPAANCGEGGECAPWLVPVAKWMGILFAAMAAGNLWANPRRGSMIDPASGDFVWYQRRLRRSEGDEGRIHPSRIGRIRIARQSDSEDEIHLYDLDGMRQSYFDSEVVPWPYEKWAKRMEESWPHIRVDIEA